MADSTVKLLLDTNVVSDFFRQHPDVLKSFGKHQPGDLCISTVTVMEIEYGFARQPAARKKFGELWEGLKHDLVVLPYEEADAIHTAQIRAVLAATGNQIGPFDLQLAGTARARSLILVTHNTDEFNRVSELDVLDWRTD